MAEWIAWLLPALTAGLFGSAHCLGMCGGLSGLFAIHAGARATTASPLLALSYNLGRLCSYAGLGALVALVGDSLTGVLPGLSLPLRLLAGLVILMMGLQIAFGWRLLGPVERVGSLLWRFIAPLAQKLLPVSTPLRAGALGLAWGLLPCGLVYSMLLVAMAGGEPLQGAIIMLAFGLGTTPAMLLAGLSALSLQRSLAGRRRALVAGLALVAIGGATIAVPLLHATHGKPEHHQHMAASDAS